MSHRRLAEFDSADPDRVRSLLTGRLDVGNDPDVALRIAGDGTRRVRAAAAGKAVTA
ncbi:hypothetical protein [Prauserella alba]|nr:hypothetical protein [Prauserella alba]